GTSGYRGGFSNDESGGFGPYWSRDYGDDQGPYSRNRGHGGSQGSGTEWQSGTVPNQFSRGDQQQGWQQQGRHPDPDYDQWRREQMQRLDEDYDAFRRERYAKFSDEFNKWRSNRPAQ